MRGITSEVQLQALDYLVNGKKEQARKAITAMLDTLKNTNFGIEKDNSRASGAMLMVGAIVYDWCYDQMKKTEKEEYINSFIRIAQTMECGYPPRDNQPISGHPSEWMIMRDLLSAGIAIYDEYPDMYNHVIKMLFRDYIPARNFFTKDITTTKVQIIFTFVSHVIYSLYGFLTKWVQDVYITHPNSLYSMI